MKNEKFKYQELIELGFEREEINDSVFFAHHGYQCFYVTKNLSKKLVLDWESTTQEIQLVRYDKKHNVLNRWENMDKQLVIKLIDFYKDQKKGVDFTYIAC